jgi:hypothetical protein
VEKKKRDGKTTKRPYKKRKLKFEPPMEVVNDNPEARKEQIRALASIIADILLSGHLNNKS